MQLPYDFPNHFIAFYIINDVRASQVIASLLHRGEHNGSCLFSHCSVDMNYLLQDK